MEALEIAAGMREIEQRDISKGLRVRHVDEREVLRENGEIDLPRTEVRLDVYPDPSGVVVELSRRQNGEPQHSLALMLDDAEAVQLIRALQQFVHGPRSRR